MSSPLTSESPLARRLHAWSQERFPAVNLITGLVIFTMTLAVVQQGQGMSRVFISPFHLLGAVALICQFIVLRVLDEHKDFEVDRINYPQRVLQRGLINLRHLQIVGFCAGLFQLLFSVFCDGGWGPTCWAWLAMTVWTGLMAKEFFCSAWLKKHLLVYAISHMMVMPFTMVWTWKMVNNQAPVTGTGFILILLTLVSGFAFEVTRKTRGLEEEKTTLDSYSKILGSQGAAAVVMTLLVIIVVTQFEILRRLAGLKSIPGADIFIAAGFLLSMVSMILYMRGPTIKARKMNEGITGLFMLINYASIIVVSWAGHDFSWILTK